MKSAARRRPEIKTASKIMERSKVMERHVHQFQIACLELERTRRMKELNIASQRVADIHERLDAIEKEMLAHAAAMTPLPPHVPQAKVVEQVSVTEAPKMPAHRQNTSKQAPHTEGKRRTFRY
jgi:hypothetical protein